MRWEGGGIDVSVCRSVCVTKWVWYNSSVGQEGVWGGGEECGVGRGCGVKRVAWGRRGVWLRRWGVWGKRGASVV